MTISGSILGRGTRALTFPPTDGQVIAGTATNPAHSYISVSNDGSVIGSMQDILVYGEALDIPVPATTSTRSFFRAGSNIAADGSGFVQILVETDLTDLSIKPSPRRILIERFVIEGTTCRRVSTQALAWSGQTADFLTPGETLSYNDNLIGAKSTSADLSRIVIPGFVLGLNGLKTFVDVLTWTGSTYAVKTTVSPLGGPLHTWMTTWQRGVFSTLHLLPDGSGFCSLTGNADGSGSVTVGTEVNLNRFTIDADGSVAFKDKATFGVTSTATGIGMQTSADLSTICAAVCYHPASGNDLVVVRKFVRGSSGYTEVDTQRSSYSDSPARAPQALSPDGRVLVMGRFDFKSAPYSYGFAVYDFAGTYQTQISDYLAAAPQTMQSVYFPTPVGFSGDGRLLVTGERTVPGVRVLKTKTA